MKIMHICPQFTDGWSYQENYLTKYHVKLGYEVVVVTSQWVYDNNKLIKSSKCDERNKDGVRIIRLPIKRGHDYNYKFKDYEGLYETMEKERPDILFIHGIQWVFINTIVKYKKRHKYLKIFADNHADYSNSATTWMSKNILHKIIWRYYANKITPYVCRFYGVTPSRVKLLTELYKIPENKCELLVMGADDELVEKADDIEGIICTREKHNIARDDFLIITGGKIDKAKYQIITLMKAIRLLNKKNIKLLIFGSIDENIKEEFDELCNENIIYIGWLNSERTYDYFAASQLAVFPGRHSVLWEQAAGQGIPLIVKWWEGTDHVDVGGNAMFFEQDTVEEIGKKIDLVVSNKKIYENMKQIAKKNAKRVFSYYDIAKRSIRK